jgi:hypothetical protein
MRFSILDVPIFSVNQQGFLLAGNRRQAPKVIPFLFRRNIPQLCLKDYCLFDRVWEKCDFLLALIWSPKPRINLSRSKTLDKASLQENTSPGKYRHTLICVLFLLKQRLVVIF